MGKSRTVSVVPGKAVLVRVVSKNSYRADPILSNSWIRTLSSGSPSMWHRDIRVLDWWSAGLPERSVASV